MKKNLLLNLIPEANRKEFLAAAKAMREDTRTWNIVSYRGEVLATVKGLQKAEETRKAIAENNEWALTDMDIIEAK